MKTLAETARAEADTLAERLASVEARLDALAKDGSDWPSADVPRRMPGGRADL